MKKIILCLVWALISGVYSNGNTSDENTLSSRSVFIEDMYCEFMVWADLHPEELPPGVKELELILSTGSAGSVQVGGYKALPKINYLKMPDGVIFSTGEVKDCVGPNDSPLTSSELPGIGSDILTQMLGQDTYDAVEFQMTITIDSTIDGFSFNFCFGSEEWPEYAGSKFADVFACFVDGENILKSDKYDVISLNSIVTTNDDGLIDLEYDGFSPIFRCSKKLTPGEHTIVFVIADVSDARLDSGVFLNSFTFSAEGEDGITPLNSYIEIPGKVYAGKLHTIDWGKPEDVSNVTFEYSLDNKTNWHPVSATSLSRGSFQWLVPNNVGGNCFLRMIDSDKDSVIVESKGFTISWGDVTFNPVANCSKGESKVISWSCDSTQSTFHLESSRDKGNNWNTISSDAKSPYQWVVNEDVGDSILLRITSNNNTEVKDTSNYFSVSSPIKVTSPNGNEKLFKGSDHVISWETSIDISTVKLEYTKDSAKTWKPIAVYVPDTGAFTWRIPDVSGEYCKVKITSNDNAIVYDESDNFFQILNGSLLIEKPNGGDTLYMGQDENITWQATGEIGDSKLEYSLDNGTTWHLIESATENDGGYLWTIPDTTSNSCKVRVESNIFSAINDESDSCFVILKPTIAVTSPNWGEVWQGFDLREITWDSKGITGNVTLSYSIGDSLSWIVADTAVPNNGTYNWRVPNQASEKCWVKISHNKYPSINDINDYPFIIEASNLDLVSITADPISATLFEKDSLKLTVTAVGQEPITYQWQKNGANIAGATTAAFEVESLTAVDSGAYRCIATNPLGSDTSSAALVALKDQFITVLSPNGGEDGDAHVGMEIKWNSDIRGYNVSIDYSLDSGLTWASVVEQTEDDGEFLWDLSFEINSEKALIKITSSLDTTVSDMSDSIFKINIWGAITVTDSSPSTEKLLVYPNPVSINNDAVQIAVPANLSGTGELTIYDNLGATLDHQQFEFTNGATLSWDLRNSAGVKVASGSYVAVLQVTDKSGEVSRFKVLFGVEE